MKEKIDEFKQYWSYNYGYVSLEFSDKQIEDWYKKYEGTSFEMMMDYAYDFHLANGLGDVQE